MRDLKKRGLILCSIIVLILLSTTIGAITKETEKTPAVSIKEENDISPQGNKQKPTNYQLKSIPKSFELKSGKEFYLDIDYKRGYKFSDNTDHFDINKETGEIRFTPEEKGEFRAVIIALKDVTHFEYKVIRFKVSE